MYNVDPVYGSHFQNLAYIILYQQIICYLNSSQDSAFYYNCGFLQGNLLEGLILLLKILMHVNCK